MTRVQIVNAHHRFRRDPRELRRYVRGVLRGERKRGWSVSVVLITGARSRALNAEFLGHRYATDVISFPLEGGMNPEGEIYVNLDRARRQAREFGVSMRNEVARLVVHGTLHLVGYDDRKRADARRMRKREDRYVAALAGPGRSGGS